MNRSPLLLMVLCLLLIGGCIILPVGHGTFIGKEIRDTDLAFMRVGFTTKSEVVENLGKGLFWEEHNILAYYWAKESTFGWAAVGGTSGKKTFREDYVLYVQFDSNDRVKRFQRLPQAKDVKTVDVKEWVDQK